MRVKYIPVDGNDLKEKATEFFKKLCPNKSFKTSDVCFQDFKLQHEIKFRTSTFGQGAIHRFKKNSFNKFYLTLIYYMEFNV